MLELIICILAVLFVILFAVKIGVGVVKFMYEWAPIVVFLGAIAAFLYFSGQINFNEVTQDEGHISTTQNQSGHSEGRE